jgi:hypothetical protein
MTADDDPLEDAEMQMVRHMMDISFRASIALAHRMEGRQHTDAEFKAAILELIAEDTEFREDAESLMALFEAYKIGGEGWSST